MARRILVARGEDALLDGHRTARRRRHRPRPRYTRRRWLRHARHSSSSEGADGRELIHEIVAKRKPLADELRVAPEGLGAPARAGTLRIARKVPVRCLKAYVQFAELLAQTRCLERLRGGA